jgi:hypothetical protein
MDSWRHLTLDEIAQLQIQHCKADDWSRVKVSSGFSANYISESTFSGDVSLGKFGKKLLLPGGIPVESGISRVHLHNCRVADDVHISHVSLYIANYSIGEGSIIENIGSLSTEGETSFGNGTSVSVLDETGGRAVTLYEGLSAQTAYVAVMNTHRPALMEALNQLAHNFAKSIRSSMGTIGSNCCIRNAGTLRNLRIGDGCEINGASILDDGCLCSSPSAFPGDDKEPLLTSAFVGANVIARHFIFGPGSVVKDGVQIERCFVGEAAELSHGFSAHDSLFFANCQMENGEACASFAGPYTVSMHKSTLLVGGMFSFCNFGSGSNQSNHFYKLGPMHNGICERGCKTGSDTYLLWPGRIGAFTFIKGRHYGNPDTQNFPFSNLIEENGKSYLTPGVTLRSIGTLRDELKWPQRDKRTSLIPSDKICFEVSNPCTAQSIDRGLVLMEQFLANEQHTEFNYNGVVLRKASLVKGRKIYQNALHVFMGAQLVRQLERFDVEALMNGTLLKALLGNCSLSAADTWSDLAGLLVPDSHWQRVLTEVEQGSLQSVEALEASWEELYRKYECFSWHSVLLRLAKEQRKEVSELDHADFSYLLDVWEEALTGFYKLMLLDADMELSKMRPFMPGETKLSHPFVVVLQQLVEELPGRVSQYKLMLQKSL